MSTRRFTKILLFSAAILCIVSTTSSCTIINSQFNPYGDDDNDVVEDDINTIMAKYDDLFENSKYEGEPCTIEMVHWDGDGQAIEMSVINTMLKGFKIRYPDINVKLTILSDYESSYSTKLTGSNIADVFLMPDGQVMSWTPLGQCEDLGPYVAKSSLVNVNKMYPSSVLRYRYDHNEGRCTETGTLIALPKDIGPTVMYYNKNAFKSAGIPYPDNEEIMSIDEAFEMWDNLKVVNDKGQVEMYGVGGLSIEGLVWSNGGDFLNSQRNAFPTDTATLAGFKKGYEYMQRSYVDMGDGKICEVQPPASWTNGSDPTKLFSNQMIACYVGLKSKVSQFRKLDFDWDVCPVPAGLVNPTANAWSGSVGYSLYKGSKNKEAAWKLIEYIGSMEGQELLSATGFQIPVYPELASQPDFIERESSNKPANFECFLDAAYDQPIGLWSYHKDQLWLSEALHLHSENLYNDDPSKRITVDQYIALVAEEVNKKLKN